jgi:hypothetical protein
MKTTDAWKRTSSVPAAAAAWALLASIATLAGGTETQVWEVSTHDEFAEGTFEGTQVDSTGELSMGIETLRAEIPGAAAVWSSLEIGGNVYLGTGNDGALMALAGDRLLEIARTDSVALTALATDGKGTLFAGSLPGGAIYRFDGKELDGLVKKASASAPKVEWKPGTESSESKKKKAKDAKAGSENKEPEAGEKVAKSADAKVPDGKEPAKGPEPWATLEGAEHVWALAWDAKRNTLYAGTGPDGLVFAVDGSGRATVLADVEDEHILSLALMPDGSLLAGTANHSRILRIDGPGRVSTVWDFGATEVKALALVEGDDPGEPVIVAAVNTFKSPPKVSAKMPSKKDLTSPKTGTSSLAQPQGGEGLVAAILPGGGYRKLLETDKTHLASMRAAGGRIQVSTGEGGRLLEVDLVGRHSVILDVGEQQVLTFDLGGQRPVLGTSDPAAVHRVIKTAPTDPFYVSDVFDAGFSARWGRFVLRGEGGARWQTRSGNTEEPDDTWSAWSAASGTADGKVTSPAARFIQYRLRIESGVRVWNTQLFFLPVNQQATITEIAFGPDPGAKGKSAKPASKTKDGKAAAPDPNVDLRWKLENADGDLLRFELWFAREGTDLWIPLLAEGEILTKAEYKWNTTSVPAGYYVVKVLATDDQVNDPSLALSHWLVSRPLLVDNDPPKLVIAAKAAKGKARIEGTVEDAFSKVARIEISIDGGPWQTLFPEDLIFDESKESFSHEIADLGKGAHTVTVRASDQGSNQTSAGAIVTVK